MQFDEYEDFKRSIIADVIDQKSISSELLLTYIINEYLVDSKRIDHEDVTIGYFERSVDQVHCRMDGYMFNTTQERLQIFLVDEQSYESPDLKFVNKADEYSALFKSSYSFIRRVFLRHFLNGDNPIIDSVPNDLTKAFIANMGLAANVRNIDTVEIFLVTLNLTVRKDPYGKLHLKEDMDVRPPGPVKFKINLGTEQISKEIDVKYSLVDLNFLYRIHTSINGREPIKIRLNNEDALDFIQVADEDDFKSYLTALPGPFLFKIYSEFSSRLLEKNIRAFLDFRNTKDNVNSGMRRTIIEEPHKFVAFNNGLTITCNHVDIENVNGKRKIVGFDDFQIVNGGQTTASIYFTAIQKNEVAKVKVMAKINMIGSHDEDFDNFVSDISNFSNAQNKVNKVDLRSNDPVLQRIKILSNSVVTPLGKKWFYEKSRGELGAVKRGNNWSNAQLNANFPKSRRFQNTELAKYYSSWGDIPYKIKKGGESVFLDFIEAIKRIGVQNINKPFYENLIGRVSLFRDLEKLHGTGRNAIGQLRSAVIPYSISALYTYTASKSVQNNKLVLDFASIWKGESITKDMEKFFLELMKQMYEWIDKYKTSTDISENTKKVDLWNAVAKSSELKQFLESNASLLSKILVKEEVRKNEFFDFSILRENIGFHNKGHRFYKALKEKFLRFLSTEESNELDFITSTIIINPAKLPGLLQQLELDIDLVKTISAKKTKSAREKILKAEVQKKSSLLLKRKQIDFLRDLEGRLSQKDPETYATLTNANGSIDFAMILEDVEFAYNEDNFDKLLTKVIAARQKGINIQYHLEYLKCLHEYGIMPKIIDIYQLAVVYKN